jgi:type I restriction enzyme S subunit
VPAGLYITLGSGLIADVVTGKLDVREAAAHLPDEPEATEAVEELDESLEDANTMDAPDLEEASLETEA